MIIESILEVDSVSPTQKMSSNSFMVETPSLPSFVPSVISTTRGNFIVVSKMFEGNRIRSGVFSHPHSRIDEIIGPLFKACYDFSIKNGLENVFSDPSSAFSHITESSGSEYQPHSVLIPSDWDHDKLVSWAGNDNLTIESGGEDSVDIRPWKFRMICNIKYCNVDLPVFLSRPDFVGLYYFFAGDLNSVVLHNLEFGMAFCKGA